MLDFSLPQQLDGQVVSGFISAHTKAGFCERNYGIGYRTKEGSMFGLYKNSDCRLSAYFVREAEVAKPHENVSVVLGLGAAIGYERIKVMPLAYPALVGTLGKASVAVGGMPKFAGYGGVAFAQARYQF